MARGPSMRHRRVVKALTRFRDEAGLTMSQAAAEAGWDTAKISKIESLRQGITGDDAYRLCQVYKVDEDTTRLLVTLARESKRRGWWHVYSDDVLAHAADLVELEDDAREILSYQIDIIPGLLQTEDYARAIIKTAVPSASRDEIEMRVQLRMERQKRVADARLWVILGEAALLQSTGSHAVIAEQLERLAEDAERPNITIQVVPFNHTGHVAQGVPFTLLRLHDGATYGYQDGLMGALYLEAPDTDRYEEAWRLLVGAALDYDRSASAIRRHAMNHKEHHESRRDDLA